MPEGGMDREVSVVINARVGSTRVPRKLIRPFADTTLLDIALEKLSRMNVKHKFLAACDSEIIKLWLKYQPKVPLLTRNEASVSPGTHDYRVSFAHYLAMPTRYVMSMNPCLPFTKVETYERAIEAFKASDCTTMTSVVRRNNIFFDVNARALNASAFVDTQHQSAIFETAHMFHIFDVDYFRETGAFWDYTAGHPHIYEVPADECPDVDRPHEFEFCELCWRKKTQ